MLPGTALPQMQIPCAGLGVSSTTIAILIELTGAGRRFDPNNRWKGRNAYDNVRQEGGEEGCCDELDRSTLVDINCRYCECKHFQYNT